MKLILLQRESFFNPHHGRKLLSTERAPLKPFSLTSGGGEGQIQASPLQLTAIGTMDRVVRYWLDDVPNEVSYMRQQLI